MRRTTHLVLITRAALLVGMLFSASAQDIRATDNSISAPHDAYRDLAANFRGIRALVNRYNEYLDLNHTPPSGLAELLTFAGHETFAGLCPTEPGHAYKFFTIKWNPATMEEIKAGRAVFFAIPENADGYFAVFITGQVRWLDGAPKISPQEPAAGDKRVRHRAPPSTGR